MAPSFSTKAFELTRSAALGLARLRGIAIVAAGGVAIFALMHYALAAALGAGGEAVFPRQRPLGELTYQRIWGRVAALDNLCHRGQLPLDTRLGIYIGVSTTATGIQRAILDERATIADRWIVLPGAGLSFENIENVTVPVFFCTLKPTVVVFGVHPQMLVGERYLPDDLTTDRKQVVGRRRGLDALPGLDAALEWLRKHWAIQHRKLMGEFLRTQMYTARLHFFSYTGVSADGLFPPIAEPWDEDPFWLWNMDDARNQVAQDQVKSWGKRGHFIAANYDPDGVQAQSFVRMIRAYRKLGATVYVVIMPERSTLRKIVPSSAKPCLYEALNRAFPTDAPRVIDLEAVMPDPLFTDEAHLSRAGAERLSKLVADQLQAPPAAAAAPAAASSPVPDGS